ncbi:MAG: hypothetical protein LBJ73_04350 [Rickettsiales bacterium]|nr:hypothetical protein [Rickettsiales bacterium]
MRKILTISMLLLFSTECFGTVLSGRYYVLSGNTLLGRTDGGGCIGYSACVVCGSASTMMKCSDNGLSSVFASTDDTAIYGTCGVESYVLHCCDGEWKEPCTACNNDSTWSNVSGQNYQQQQYNGTCTDASCSSAGICSGRSVRYRCKSGYYGTGTNCTACPRVPLTNLTSGSAAVATSTPGSNATIETCQIAPGPYSDSTGEMVISNTCNYSN